MNSGHLLFLFTNTSVCINSINHTFYLLRELKVDTNHIFTGHSFHFSSTYFCLSQLDRRVLLHKVLALTMTMTKHDTLLPVRKDRGLG